MKIPRGATALRIGYISALLMVVAGFADLFLLLNPSAVSNPETVYTVLFLIYMITGVGYWLGFYEVARRHKNSLLEKTALISIAFVNVAIAIVLLQYLVPLSIMESIGAPVFFEIVISLAVPILYAMEGFAILRMRSHFGTAAQIFGIIALLSSAATFIGYSMRFEWVFILSDMSLALLALYFIRLTLKK
jgi:hypothetical protein